jgi:hypothetical protein
LFPQIARDAVVLAGTLTQGKYDPFKPPDIGRRQEFGDVLAEGLFRLFHEDGRVEDAEHPEYWRRVVEFRREFLAQVDQRLRDGEGSERLPRMVRFKARRALKLARRRLTPLWMHPLAEWVVDWQRDLNDWGSALREIPHLGDLKAALSHLGLGDFTAIVPARGHAPDPGDRSDLPRLRTPDQELAAIR